MGYFGIQVHDKNGSICINSLLSFPAAGEDGENRDVFLQGRVGSWSSLAGPGVGSAGCRAGVWVLHPTASHYPNNGNGCFSGEGTVFPTEGGGGVSHPLPWIQSKVRYWPSLVPHADSQLILCYF